MLSPTARDVVLGSELTINFEGRSFRGWQHHVVFSALAYMWLQ
jgi:hypothetical protein